MSQVPVSLERGSGDSRLPHRRRDARALCGSVDHRTGECKGFVLLPARSAGACDALAEPEELRVVGHAVGRPGWVERQLDLDLLDPGQ